MQKIIQFMKRNYKIIIPIILLAGVLLSFKYINKPDPDKDKALIKVLRLVLTQGHYQPTALNDSLSKKVYNRFIDILDPTKHYFMASDIEEFDTYKYSIDNQIMTADLTFFYTVYDRYALRVSETRAYYKTILGQPIDITLEETHSVDYKKSAFSKNKEDLKKVWQKQLKLRYLALLFDKEKVNTDKIKNDSTYIAKSLAVLKEEALEKTMKNMDNLYDRIEELDRDDWFSYYANSITAEFGPHTTYLAPKIKKKFDISMSGKLEGIGARLQKEGDYTKIVSLISGGPAWRAGELEVGDFILKVAQGDAEPLDIVGMRLDDAIEFIKGKKGTEVRLTLKKVDGSIETISIIRDVVELEETFVKSSIITKEAKKYGLINLPQFYIDFDEKNYRNSATDMAKELTRLKKEGVSGILIDLRNNGGGSLKTAIEIAGLFIDKGPVVQVKYRGEKAQVRTDNNAGTLWDGPLVVLVNEFSASASEIFAAAMQDYKRAVIIGSEQTFGKGTVQNILPLNSYIRSHKDLGFLKMTIQKFYRINGGSTQLKGVTPDIALPSRYKYLEIGERDEDNPMEWDKIDSVNYTKWNRYSNFDSVVANSNTRVEANEYFKLVEENAKWLKESKDDTTVYLSYKAYKDDIKNHEENAKKFDSLENYVNKLEINCPKYEVSLVAADSILKKKRTIWHKNLTKDLYINEAIRVLEDLKVGK